MRKYVSLFVLLALAFFSGKVQAQTPAPTPPDCVVYLNNLTTTAQVPSVNGFDNRFIGCTSWTLQYTATGFVGLTITFQSSPGSSTPTGFVTFAGTVVTGSAVMTSTTGQISTYSNGTVVTPFVRVLFQPGGAGTLDGVLYGYKTGYTGGSSSGGSGCAGTIATPCIVAGPAASGAALSGAPVRIGISDGTNAQNVVSASTVGDASTGVGVPTSQETLYNGATFDRRFACTNQAVITISSGTDAVIVSGVAAKTTRICHLDFASDTQATFTIRQGTGVTCGTNTATLAGGYPNILTLAEDYTPLAPLLTTVAARDVCIHSSASATIGGVVIYAQY